MSGHDSVIVQVFVFKNGEFYGTDCFAQAEVHIGRGEASDLHLEGEEVSREHAVLRVCDQGLILEDLGSVNGTCVNGEAVQRVFVEQWDEVSIGEFTLKVKVIDSKRKRPPIREARQVTRTKTEDAEPTMAEPPPVAAVVQDEEEEDLEHFVEPFSLLSNLVRESFKKPVVPTEADPVMEVIRYSPERQVRAYDQVSYSGRYRIGRQKFPLLRYHSRYACRLMFTSELTGGVIRGNRTVSLDEFKTPKNRMAKWRGENVYALTLMKGDFANLMHAGSGAFMRFVHPPVIPRKKKKRKLDKTSLKILGSTFAGHLLIILMLGILTPRVNAAIDRDMDKFARVDLADIPMTKPQEDPEYAVYQPPVETEKQPQPEPEKKQPVRRPKPSKGLKGGGGKGKGGGAGPGMMAALGKLSKKKGVAVDVTNIDAHRSPAKARYMISGMAVRQPTRSVLVAKRRGLGVRGEIDLLGGGKGRGGKTGYGPGELEGGLTGKRDIGAVVFESPKRRIKKKGHLTKEEIARVVKQNLREIQYCYEKNLLRDSKLKGKLIMEWTIVSTGRVSLVKTRFNSMRSVKVARCVSKNIRKWEFPCPRGGGTVEVEYPFLFEQVGFD